MYVCQNWKMPRAAAAPMISAAAMSSVRVLPLRDACRLAHVEAGVDGVLDQLRPDELERRQAGQRDDSQQERALVRPGVGEQPHGYGNTAVLHDGAV